MTIDGQGILVHLVLVTAGCAAFAVSIGILVMFVASASRTISDPNWGLPEDTSSTP